MQWNLLAVPSGCGSRGRVCQNTPCYATERVEINRIKLSVQCFWFRIVYTEGVYGNLSHALNF